ncbi:hypothetical protein B6U99_00685 [Candidatus Geothermarchaeota archaeon ex4572_27]|nr:MAG: hypothetical protein B6U99_00685 [Candidatus Geothermarchaeota archaeon ex4572_27]
MRIWIDVLTPKQVLFFRGIAERLAREGVELLVTVRDFRETVALARALLREFSPVIVGRYGGGDLEEKLRRSLERSLSLIRVVRDFRPSLALSYCSPEAARVAFGLGVEHQAVSDIPQAEAVSRLTLPLSSRLYTPWVIPLREWVRYGIARERICRYRALDPIAWLRRHRFDAGVAEDLGLQPGRYIVVRTVEAYASYQLPHLREARIDLRTLVSSLLDRLPDHDVVVLERYEDRLPLTRAELKGLERVVVPMQPVDGPSLLRYAAGFIGYGGTMTAEAALMGVPAVSLRPGRTPHYIRFLVRAGLVRECKTSEGAVRALLRMMRDRGGLEARAREVASAMEDPADYISEAILGLR